MGDKVSKGWSMPRFRAHEEFRFHHKGNRKLLERLNPGDATEFFQRIILAAD